MKVLLFVQTGDERPEYKGRLGQLGEVLWNRCPAALKTVLGEYGISTEQQRAIEAADRWWLVKCENADAGRATLAYCGGTGLLFLGGIPPRPGDDVAWKRHRVKLGRILASGGKR